MTQTPALDALVAEGIELTRFYAFKYCSPSRSAFISGRNPIHVNVVNGAVSFYYQKGSAVACDLWADFDRILVTRSAVACDLWANRVPACIYRFALGLF